MRQHKLFWGSSYDRGLDILLPLWPKALEKFPDATLDICYGWNLFIAGYRDNPERMDWMKRMNHKMKQQGITHHGRVGKKELGKIRQSCGIWSYPTYFQEINCITALECQRDGVVPVTMDFAALKEMVQSGVKVEGDIYEPEVKGKYMVALLDMMSNENKWLEEQKKGQEFVKSYTWDKIAKSWMEEFK